jgi:1,4-alpha-glucan branching enzyme
MKEKKSAKKLSTKKGNGKHPVKKSANKLGAVKGNGKKSADKNGTNGIKKEYQKSNDLCNVTFRLPKDAAPDARVITIVGDFNSWNLTETPMKKMKNGDFQVTLKLPRGKEYKFKYFIDSNRWENDWSADRYVPNAFGCDDSLVIV